MSRKTKNAIGTTIRVLVLVFFFLLVVLPIYWIVITSFKTSGEILDLNNITFFPKDFTLENYTGLFEQFHYGVLLKEQLARIGWHLRLLLRYSLCWEDTLWRVINSEENRRLFYFFLITQMIPGILVIIPLYIIFSKLGMINTHIGLFIYYVTVNLPFCVITMRSFFERIPITLEEAAKVDGCTKMQSLFKIVFPIMFPGIVSVFVFGFIGAWNELIAGSIFISTPEMWTIPVGLKTLIGKYNVEWGLLMAGGVMALIPTALMFAVMQKFIVEGMTAGAVKE